MGSKWPVVRLGNHCLKIGSGATPKGGSSVYSDSGSIWLIRSQNIYNDGFNPSGLVFISEDAADKLKNVIVQENDILLNITGDSVARVCLAKKEYLPARVNQHVAIIRPDPKHFDARYLRYVLASPIVQQILLNLASAGATRNALTKSMIEEFEVSKPPLSIQIAVADHLESFDDKITLNRQINQTLEQIAQALFKSWFVDFDPVIDNSLDAGNEIPEPLRARAELRQKVRASQDFQPLPADVLALFPAEFEESELGWVPKGWEVGTLNSVASYTSGRVDISELNLNNYISTENMLSDRQGVCSASSLPTVQTVPSYAKGHILISNIRPYFKKIWFAYGTGGRSNDVLGFSANQTGAEDYLYNLLYQDVFFDFMMTTSKGSKMPRGDKDAIMDWPLVIPSMELRRFYSLKCKASRSFGEMHRNENETLEQLRDTLLPKLISGELRLDEIPSC